jgi:hypothetical protein
MPRGESSPVIKVIDLVEAKANVEHDARECQTSPVVVLKDGKPCFELLPIRAAAAAFLDRRIEHDPAIRNLLDERPGEFHRGQAFSLESVREWLDGLQD